MRAAQARSTSPDLRQGLYYPWVRSDKRGRATPAKAEGAAAALAGDVRVLGDGDPVSRGPWCRRRGASAGGERACTHVAASELGGYWASDLRCIVQQVVLE